MPIDQIQSHPFYAWLAANPDWIALSILLISFVESFAIVGIVVPGVFLLYVAAFLAGSGLLDWPASLGMAFIGAVLGDGSSYFLGRYFHQDIRKLPVLKRNLHWLDHGEHFMQQHGIKAIVAGRFIGPIRPIMPLVAGSLSMPALQFFTVNALSALAWAPVYILPGFALGAALDMPFTSLQLTLIALLALLVIGGFFYAIRRWFNREEMQP